jgi:MFS family permease
MLKPQYTRILKKWNFTAFWIGMFSFKLADNLFTVGLFWWILKATRSEETLGIVGTLSFTPMFVFGLLSGALTDRFDRRKLLTASALTRGVLIPLIPLLHYLGLLQIWNVYLLTFIQGISSTFFFVASSAIVPHLVSQESLMAANSLVDASAWTGNIIGFLAGGILVDSLGAMNLLTMTLFLLLVSALSILLLKFPPNRTAVHVLLSTILSDLAKGLNAIKKDKAILTFIVTWMGIQMLFAGGPMSIGWPVFSEKILNAGPEGYGLLVVAISVSALLGSFVIGQWGASKSKGRTIIIGFIWGAIGMFIFALTTTLWAALIIAALWNLCYPMINIPVMTAVQERVSDEELGTMFGASNMIGSAVTPISMLMAGFIMQRSSVVVPFQLFALALGACSIMIYIVKEARTAR